MEAENQSEVPQFLLLGLSEDPDLQPLLFGVFLSMYLTTVLGNLLIVLAVGSDSRLHTPMYFFLSNLSLMDICLTTTIVPRMLVSIWARSPAISYAGCLTQVYFSMIFSAMDTLLLSVMAYDRFVAICHPLHYMVIMNPGLCGLLLLCCWGLIFAISLINIIPMARLTFCPATRLPHFFCEVAQLIKAACSDPLVSIVCMYVSASVLGVVPLAGILCSYGHIVVSLIRMSSAGGRAKAFSTCSSHLSVVALFYGTGLWIYLASVVSPTTERIATASVMYTVVTPMLNPFIYTLRNRDVQGALGRLLSRAVPYQALGLKK
ncbi:olfactory receptor 7D4-like [Sorex araneus]|uniref:olfactory receptor 7D4-like n=1 Tax=Sorex araneus TaxID=42254 RepID=UPI002433F44D|nr:olfactory receptor 7D4-like [Sorex araneus]